MIDTSYKGYHDTKDLPVKAGNTVILPRGTRVTGYNMLGSKTLKRAQQVKVHHVLPGQSVRIGDVYPDGTVAINGCHRRELDRYCEKFGIETRGWCDEAAYRKLADLPQAERREERPGWVQIWLHLENPKVVWPGSGGYWREADINDVQGTQEV